MPYRVPDRVIFCVIDNLGLYRDRDEALLLLQGLSQLVHEVSHHCTLKVLLTGVLPHEVGQIIPSEQLVVISSRVDEDG